MQAGRHAGKEGLVEPVWRNPGEQMNRKQRIMVLEITVEGNKENGMSTKAKTQKTPSGSTMKSTYWTQTI